MLLAALACGNASANSLELSGQTTSLAFRTEDSLGKQGVTDLSRLRLNADASVNAWRAYVSYDHELLWGAQVRDPLFSRSVTVPVATWLDSTQVIRQQSSAYWQHTLYRGWLDYDQDQLHVRLGRQRIGWGSGRIWNPTDRFNPVAPTALEPDQKLGVDALLASFRSDNAGSLTWIAAPGRASHRLSRKSALRWQLTRGEADIALMAAMIGDERVMGVDLTGNISEWTARLELMQSWQGTSGTYTQISAGVDGNIVNSWFENGLYLALEYFYNGDPVPVRRIALAQQTTDRLQTASRHQAGISIGYDVTPLLRLDALVISEFSPQGVFAQPSIKYNAMDNLDLTMLMQWQSASANATFAVMKPLYALRLDWYF